jgi:hypothetical protein
MRISFEYYLITDSNKRLTQAKNTTNWILKKLIQKCVMNAFDAKLCKTFFHSFYFNFLKLKQKII